MKALEKRVSTLEGKVSALDSRVGQVEKEVRNLKLSYESSYKKLRNEPEISLMLARKTAESLSKKIYSHFNGAEKNNGKPPDKMMLEELIRENRKYVPDDVVLHFENIQRFGNCAIHDQSDGKLETSLVKISSASAVAPIASLGYITQWVFQNIYDESYTLPELMEPHLLADNAKNNSESQKTKVLKNIRKLWVKPEKDSPLQFDFIGFDNQIKIIENFYQNSEYRNAITQAITATKIICVSLCRHYGFFKSVAQEEINKYTFDNLLDNLSQVSEIKKTVIENIKFIASMEELSLLHHFPDSGEVIEDNDFITAVIAFNDVRDWFVRKYKKLPQKSSLFLFLYNVLLLGTLGIFWLAIFVSLFGK